MSAFDPFVDYLAERPAGAPWSYPRGMLAWIMQCCRFLRACWQAAVLRLAEPSLEDKFKVR